MLQRLSIRNFVLIDELSIDFSSGLTAITGETGAGKSILLGAIGLLLGHRADTATIRPGAERCVIEAHFSRLDDTVVQLLEQEDIEADTEELIIRREISIKGKSRAFVNDTPASLNLLKQLSEYLIDIHSQHKNLLLGDAHFQLSVLDLYSDNTSLRANYALAFERWREQTRELEDLKRQQAESLKEQDYLQYQFDQLEEAELEDGELEELELEEQQLAHAQEIKEELGSAYEALEHDEQGVLQGLHRALEAVGSITDYLPGAEDLYDRLESAKIELTDLMHTLESEADNVEYNPKRLDEVNERLDELNALLQKHHVRTIAELLEVKDSLEQRLSGLTSADERIAELEGLVKVSLTEAEALANQLHQVREETARQVEQALVASLKELGMPFVRFQIRLDKSKQLTPSGWDQATFLFSANKDMDLEPVAEIASGGEISRVMLSIKALIADRKSLPTIIFDEIDTGVSGDIADKIGHILRSMGRTMQVMAVTHLPQIAAAGHQHIYIYKEHGESATRSHLIELDEQGRIEEIARMQSGSKLTEVSLSAAKALLEATQGS